MKHSSRAILLGIAAWSVAACGSDDPVAPPALTNPVAGIVLSASTDSLLVGATMTVDARALDSSGVLLPGVALSWRSLDAAVATVDGAGHVQTLTAGTARIVAAALGAADTLTVAALPPLAFASTLTIGPAWRDLALKSVALGDFTSCAITTDGAAWCSGSDGGQLGTGVVGTKPAPPVPVGGGYPFAAIAVTWYASCGVTTAGRALCWGSNGSGSLGTGDALDAVRPVPTAVASNETFASISAGIANMCALTTDGRGFCWGENPKGQLGSTAAAYSAVPRLVRGPYHWRQLAAGTELTCGITTDGELFCWGADVPF